MPLNIEFGYNVRKAAHVAAYFALKSAGSIHTRKVAILAYLSDRLFLERYDEPILFDHLVSGEHGPVGTMFHGLLNGEIESGDWESVITAEANHRIGLSNPHMVADDLDDLSEAEVAVLSAVWEKFGDMDYVALSNYASTECPEWERSKESFAAIPYSRVFKFLGRHERSVALEEDIVARMELNGTLARIEHDVAYRRAS